MSTTQSDEIRRLVPLWRVTTQINESYEFSSLPAGKARATPNSSHLDTKLENWSQHKSVGVAMDIYATAKAVGDIESARKALTYLKTNSKKLPDSINSYLKRETFSLTELSAISGEQVADALIPDLGSLARARIVKLKKKLAVNPRNVLACMDMARAYSVLGQSSKSEIFAKRALILAPDHRYILRNVARYFLHTGDFEQAYNTIRRSPATKHDPWLISAELAIAVVADKSPALVRQARSMLANTSFDPGHLTELQGAMGTLEFLNGANRKSRKSIRASLIQPTENSIAQARWIGSQIGGIEITNDNLAVQSSHEARFFKFRENGQWEDALSESVHWLLSEPYSGRPSRMAASLCISVIGDAELAFKFCKLGLTVAPKNNELLNLSTIACAYLGNLPDALDSFRKIELGGVDRFPRYVFLATAGLLYFRCDDPKQGRDLYTKAEELAPQGTKRLVRLFRAREEIACGDEGMSSFVERSINEVYDKEDLWATGLQHLVKLDRSSEIVNSVREMNTISSISDLKNLILPRLGDG